MISRGLANRASYEVEATRPPVKEEKAPKHSLLDLQVRQHYPQGLGPICNATIPIWLTNGRGHPLNATLFLKGSTFLADLVVDQLTDVS
jgi:hypothetical protein